MTGSCVAITWQESYGDRSRPTPADAFVQVSRTMPTMTGNGR